MRKLSFCTTYKNRFHQISKTLPKNLDDNHKLVNQVDFIIVDFGPDDKLQKLLEGEYVTMINSGFIKYFRTQELKNWHMSIAKNTAHGLSKSDILVNLDCDNYTGYCGANFILSFFKDNGKSNILHQFSKVWGDGTSGRIALHRDFFEMVGGYDESFYPAGYQDIDLILRLVKTGLSYRNINNDTYNKTIKNTKEECIEDIGLDIGWKEMELRNRNKSELNISQGKLVANNGLFGIRKNVYKHNGTKLELYKF